MHISRELSENTFYAIQEGTNFGVVVQDVNPMSLHLIQGELEISATVKLVWST